MYIYTHFIHTLFVFFFVYRCKSQKHRKIKCFIITGHSSFFLFLSLYLLPLLLLPGKKLVPGGNWRPLPAKFVGCVWRRGATFVFFLVFFFCCCRFFFLFSKRLPSCLAILSRGPPSRLLLLLLRPSSSASGVFFLKLVLLSAWFSSVMSIDTERSLLRLYLLGTGERREEEAGQSAAGHMTPTLTPSSCDRVTPWTSGLGFHWLASAQSALVRLCLHWLSYNEAVGGVSGTILFKVSAVGSAVLTVVASTATFAS